MHRLRPEGLRVPFHGDWDRAAVELDPRNFDRVDDPARHVDEDRRSHADLERPCSDNASFLKSRVTHRVSLAPGRGRRGRLPIGRDGRRGPESGTHTSTLLSIRSEYDSIEGRGAIEFLRGRRRTGDGCVPTRIRSFFPSIIEPENPGTSLKSPQLHEE